MGTQTEVAAHHDRRAEQQRELNDRGGPAIIAHGEPIRGGNIMTFPEASVWAEAITTLELQSNDDD